jgi:hypothetical protein
MIDETHIPDESCQYAYRSKIYVALYVSPRGFSGESSTYIGTLDDTEYMTIALGKIDRCNNRQPGTDYKAHWLPARIFRPQIIWAIRMGNPLITLAEGSGTALLWP